MATPSESTLKHLGWLVGRWTTEATHPAMPGVIVHGTAEVEWLEGEQFLLLRGRTDHPQFPDSLSVVGFMDRARADSGAGEEAAHELVMHYYDSRGVFREYRTSIDEAEWRWWRDDPKFPQRCTFSRRDGGDTIVGRSQVREDGSDWKDDLAITYRRAR
jgi:hypothetical protein